MVFNFGFFFFCKIGDLPKHWIWFWLVFSSMTVFCTTPLKQLIQQISLWSLHFYLVFLLGRFKWICGLVNQLALLLSCFSSTIFSMTNFCFRDMYIDLVLSHPRILKMFLFSFEIQLWCHITYSKALYNCISDSQVSNL